MTPFDILWLCIFAVFAVVIVRLLRREEPPVSERPVEPATAGDGYHFARPNVSFEKIRAEHPPRQFGQRAAPPIRKPTCTLTPRQIERVNIQRKLINRPPLTRAGIQNAIAHPWDRASVTQPQNPSEWLAYLIAYEVLNQDHIAHTVYGARGVIIDPNLPYNGQGGEFAGAGASGDWSDANTRSVAAAIEHGIPSTGNPQTQPDPYLAFAAAANEGGKYQPGDEVGGYGSKGGSGADDSGGSAPDPTPSFDSSSSSTSFDTNGGNP